MATFKGSPFIEDVTGFLFFDKEGELILAWTTLGQTTSGITGVVTDPSGAVVPGVTVTLADTKSAFQQTTVRVETPAV